MKPPKNNGTPVTAAPPPPAAPPTNEVAAPPAPAPTTEAAVATAPITALAVPPTADVVAAEPDAAAEEFAALKALAARLPTRYSMDILSLKRPFPEEMSKIVQALPEAAQQKIVDLVRKTRPKKQGVHTSREGFQPLEIGIFHGTGNNPMRPDKMSPGEFFTNDKRVFPTPFDAAVVMFYEGRTLWPPRDSGEGKNPLCVSHDRKRGSKYGDCNTCPYANKKYTEGGCGRDVVLYLVDRDLTGIYTLRCNKTSTQAGEAVTKIVQKDDEIFTRWFRFELQERTNTKGDQRWYVLKTSPVVDSKNRENEVVPKAYYPLFNAFSRLIERDVYYPSLAGIYTRSENAESPASESAGETVDLEAMKTGTPSSQSPDFSA